MIKRENLRIKVSKEGDEDRERGTEKKRRQEVAPGCIKHEKNKCFLY